MATAFTRQLGAQVGVQLDPIRDRTDAFSLGQFDQTCALVGKFNRGRIDKPFRVNRGTLSQRLGRSQSIALSLLNISMTTSKLNANIATGILLLTRILCQFIPFLIKINRLK